MIPTSNIYRLSGHLALVALALGSLFLLGCSIGPQAKSQPQESPPATTPGPIVLSWTAAGEHQIYGYHVYRGRSADGPFDRVNQDILPAAGTTDLAQRYTFVDDNAAVGVQYFYFVESVSFQGTRKRLTPIKSFTRKPIVQGSSEDS